MTYSLKLGPANTLNLGAGTAIVSDSWMQKYFGVTNGSDIALYPALAGLPFNARGGVKGGNLSLILTQALGRSWLLSFGFHFEKLMNDAKISPRTAQRGSSNQWMNSAVLSYLF